MSSLPESLLRFRTELEDAIRRELEAQATARSNGRGARVLRAVRRRPGRTTLALAAVVGTAAAALFVGSPWKSPPGFLEQVQAAVTPRAGTVLHMKLVMTMDMVECKVTHPPLEMWVDLAAPHNWRSLDVKQTEICKAGTTVEIGGKTISRQVLGFVPPNTLAIRRDFASGSVDPDPFGHLRQSIDDGTAHREGTTVLDGRTVERIRIDCDSAKFPGCGPIYAFVDPETFLPCGPWPGPACGRGRAHRARRRASSRTS